MPWATHRGWVSIERKQLGFGPGLVCSLVSHLLSHRGCPYLIEAVSPVPYRLSTSGSVVHLPRVKWLNEWLHCVVLCLKRGFNLDIMLFYDRPGEKGIPHSSF